MADIQLLLKLGKELDLSGQELRDWVDRKAAEQKRNARPRSRGMSRRRLFRSRGRSARTDRAGRARGRTRAKKVRARSSDC